MNTANEISPFLKIIFDQYAQSSKLPDDWVEAYVAPGIGTLRQTTGRYPSHVFVPNYSNTSFVSKLCPIFFKTQNFNTCTFDKNTHAKASS